MLDVLQILRMLNVSAHIVKIVLQINNKHDDPAVWLSLRMTHLYSMSLKKLDALEQCLL